MSKFDSNWESLEKYEVPKWFKDAKFGIFMHWGIHTIPMYHAWYGRKMYMQIEADGDMCYEHHIENYGHPSKFGFKDFIPMWKGENFDAIKLANYFKSIGVKYLVPVIMYHDNFDNFNSKYQKWNSVNMGPKKDILGEWRKACDETGLKLGASDHASRAWEWLSVAHGSDELGDKKGIKYDGRLTEKDGYGTWWEGYNPQELYLEPHNETDPEPKEFIDTWKKRITQMTDHYKLDLLYFDWDTLPHKNVGLEIASEFYNKSAEKNNGIEQVVINIKDPKFPKAVVHDVEKGRFEEKKEYYWQTDTTLNHDWFYLKDKGLRFNGKEIIHMIADIISKNGNLLLNVGLLPDGTIPKEQKEALDTIGEWVNRNEEAIFESRPFVIYGEDSEKDVKEINGDTSLDTTGNFGEGHFNERHIDYTNKDIRFTCKGNSLYIFVMNRPENKTIIKSLGKSSGNLNYEIQNITLIGNDIDISWSHNENELIIDFKDETDEETVYVYEVKLKEKL